MDQACATRLNFSYRAPQPVYFGNRMAVRISLRADGRREVVLEELRRRDPALPVLALDDQLGVEGERRRREVARGVGVGECPAEGPAVADLEVRHRLRGLADQLHVLVQQVVAGDLVVGRHGPDHDLVAVLAHPAQFGDAAEVDHQRRVTHAQAQDRDEALAAGHELRVVAAVDQRLERLVDRGRPDVVERCRDHRCPPWVSPFEMSLAVEPSPAPGEAMSASSPRPEVPFAELIAVHTRYGVVGMSMSVTPY